MNAFVALRRLGLDWLDVQILTRDLLDAIADRNRDLLESFTKGA